MVNKVLMEFITVLHTYRLYVRVLNLLFSVIQQTHKN